MNAVRPSTDLVRISDIDKIIAAIAAGHPHVVGQNVLRKFIERQRIGQALKMEAKYLSYCLVALQDADGSFNCGVLVATPGAGAGDMFENYGPAPAFFGFLFGFNRFEDFETVFDDAIAYAAEQQSACLFGPVEITINYSIGLAESEAPFPPSILMPENPVEWNEWFERYGLEVAERLFTYEIEYANVDFTKFRDKLAQAPSLRIETLTAPFSDAQKQAIVEVFNSGWSSNWGFVEIDADSVAALEREFKPLLWNGLAYVAWLNNRPAVIAVAVPDINEVFRAASLPGSLACAWRMLVRKKARTVKILLLGLADGLHGSVLGLAIIERILNVGREAAERYGVTHVQMGWTLESNRRVNRLVAAWAPEAKCAVHRVWRHRLRPEVV